MNTTPTLSLNPQEVSDGTGTATILAARAVTLWTQPEHGRHVGLSAAVLNFARMLG